MWLLDTNIWIALLNGTAPEISERYRSHRPLELSYASMNKAELLYGAAKSSRREKSTMAVETILSPHAEVEFGSKASVIYGSIRAHLEKKGTPISGEDLIIASCALASERVLVTRNQDEFRRVPGLKVESWT
jgi:tRNA(fMet)-specific endonuclease VapC